ncbi:peptidoglycan-binding domain-containing protein [Nocardiopsis ganjiahuensis]|uniref:peptidoglycan-binding domain-containing protein n=1 Tax=Nocardiopsis ganjiahuensis TaxID=239984 RepID=UPI00034A5C17|nr:peptidoglycan-binding domain-containing protein [Nocardiopsis ganjiahuensis]
MSILIDNRLSGDDGVQVSNSTLATSAESGTVIIAAPGSRAVYDDVHTVHGLPSVRIESGHHRQDTPRLRVNLPSSGAWSVRWYVWMPPLGEAGHGANEVRWHGAFPDTEVALTVQPSGSGTNINTRLQPDDLAANAILWDSETGTSVPLGQWLRIELRYDGSDLTCRTFAGHTTVGERVHTWSGRDVGRTLDLTGYRFRRRTTLRIGDQGSDVTDLQNELIDLGEDLSPWGADGDFGSGTQSAVMNQQSALGLALVDGEAGPETRAAMDLALNRIPDPLWVSHVAVAEGEWIGPAEAPPEPAPMARLRVGLPI